MPTLASMPASTSVRSARSRCHGGAVPGSVSRQISGSRVGIENVTPTSARSLADARTSTSRTIIGPRVMSPIGVRASPSASIAPRVRRKRPSAGWYGSVAVPTTTCSRFHDRRASSRRSTSTRFVLTRIDVP